MLLLLLIVFVSHTALARILFYTANPLTYLGTPGCGAAKGWAELW